MIICQFNILGFKREAEQGSQSVFPLAYQNQKYPKCASPIYFYTQVYPEWVFFSIPKSEIKCPKYAGPIYFHAQVYPEWVFFSVPNSEIKVPNTPARFISTRMYLGKEFLWQFLLISLLRSLAPRLNNLLDEILFFWSFECISIHFLIYSRL